MRGYFDIKKDNQLIVTGTHFFCRGHLSAVPIVEKSSDERYCQQCLTIVKANDLVDSSPSVKSIKNSPTVTQKAVHKFDIAKDTSQTKRGRPAIEVTPSIRKVLVSPGTVRDKAGILGIGKSKVAMLIKQEAVMKQR